ncbi:MAG: PQQ-binding-like beta-propeller repeat protein [Vicinamibacteraceae bacterium]
MRTAALAIAGALGVFSSVLAGSDPAGQRFWPQWRGPDATGASKQADPPIEWSETSNIRWKVEIPGRGSATPVIWGDRIFLLTSVPKDVQGEAAHEPRGGVEPRVAHRFTVLALDRRTGRVVWEQVAKEETPHEGAHRDHGTWASSSAVTDGTRVFASFESHGVYAYDMDGKLLWQKDLGDKQMRNQFGEGSTPALYNDQLVLVWDHQGNDFIVALDAPTGKELWRRERDEIDSWATPLIVEHNGRAQVVTSAMNRVRSYDLETGEEVWQSEGTTMNPIPSPVAAEGMVFVTAGFRGSDLKAIRLAEAKGDITGSGALAWTLDRDTPYVPSPLLYNGILYLLKSNSGILSAFDARSGKPHYQLQRLQDVPEVFASPVGASDRVYIPGRDGKTMVLRHGPTFEVLATNTLEDGFDASPAVVDKEIYLRGHRYLYCIAAS